MVTRKILEEHGVTAEAWREQLESTRVMQTTPDPLKPVDDLDMPEKIRRLHNRIRSRVQKGRDYNLLNYRTVQAIELCWEAPFRQISPTLIANLIRTYRPAEGKQAEKKMLDALNASGLNIEDLLYDTGERDPKTGESVKILSVPTLIHIIWPLVRGYVEIRRAKLVNDRNLRPFHKFECPVSNDVQRLLCQILTSRIEVMAQQYGYIESLKQAVLQMLLFGTCLQFTQESWHSEEQLKYAGKDDLDRTGSDGKALAGKIGDEITYTAKEGLRFYHPHPSRMFWDMAHPAWTFNTDTGCEYAGFWSVMRYKEILDNPLYYNKDRVSYGPSTWWATNVNFFNSVYNLCAMEWPQVPAVPDGEDREKYLAERTTYNETMSEMAVAKTEYRERLIPSEYGLGDYDYPIWARFVLAGDNSTIMFAEPLCYQGVTCYRYNGDDRKIEDASMALQLVPAQDMLSNLLTQYIYAARQNLTNLTLIDSHVLDDTDGKGKTWEKIKNLGERLIRGINILKYDSKYYQKLQVSPQQAFYSHRFPQLDTNGILQSIKLVLDLAERTLQFSAQEIAQAASHEQTKAEMQVIAGSTSQILAFTGQPIDAGMCAQARQLYDALMAYGDDDFYAQIPMDHRISKDELEGLGITYVFAPKIGDRQALVRVNKKKSAVDSAFFSIVPSYYERNTNMDQARVVSEMVRDWLITNPIGQSALGPDQLVALFNHVCAKLLNLPLPNPIVNAGFTGPEVVQQMQQQIASVVQAVRKEVKEGQIPVMQAIQELNAAVVHIYQVSGVPLPSAQPTQPQIPNANPNPEQAPTAAPGPGTGPPMGEQPGADLGVPNPS